MNCWRRVWAISRPAARLIGAPARGGAAAGSTAEQTGGDGPGAPFRTRGGGLGPPGRSVHHPRLAVVLAVPRPSECSDGQGPDFEFW